MAVAEHLHQLRGRRILFLNWRDRRHPEAGGAEHHCQTLAESFARVGADVTLFTAAHKLAARDEIDNGVMIVRRGGRLTLYLHAAIHLIRFRSSYDVVVDVQNGIPFFAPLFTRRKTAVVGVIHHVHQDQFGMYMSRLLSVVGRILEGPVSRRVYRRVPTIVVSPSTREAVRRQLRYRGLLHIVPNGQIPQTANVGRSESPTITFVGRLVAHKRVDLLLEAVATLKPTWSELDVHICGTGPAGAELEQLTADFQLADVVTLHGYLPEAKRNELISAAWLTVNPSLGEGWGLTVLESNSLGVPTLAFDVPGLRDAIVHGETGWLISRGPEALAAEIHRALVLLSDADTAMRIGGACRSWAARFSWQRSAEWAARILVDEINRSAHRDWRRPGPRDLAVIAEFHSQHPNDMARRVRRELRLTDDWANDGETFRVLLRGCDELEAMSGLGRLGVEGSANVRLATSRDMLLGVEGLPE